MHIFLYNVNYKMTSYLLDDGGQYRMFCVYLTLNNRKNTEHHQGLIYCILFFCTIELSCGPKTNKHTATYRNYDECGHWGCTRSLDYNPIQSHSHMTTILFVMFAFVERFTASNQTLLFLSP